MPKIVVEVSGRFEVEVPDGKLDRAREMFSGTWPQDSGKLVPVCYLPVSWPHRGIGATSKITKEA